MQSNEDLFIPHMPEVFVRNDVESVFARARASAVEPSQSAEGIYHRQIIVVTPGRLLIAKDCPLASEMSAGQIAILEKFIPRKPVKQICVIAFTELDALKSDMRKAIPFIDYLLGFSALGHTVWVFEGHSSSLAAGCRDADLLLIDSAMLPFLEEDPLWREKAQASMRGNEIKLISRG
jgi:hypothetical protein